MDRNVTAALMLAGGGVLAAAGLSMALGAGRTTDTTDIAAQPAASVAHEQGAAAGWGNGRGNGQGLGNGGGNGVGRGAGGRDRRGTATESHAGVIPPAVPGATISTDVATALAFMVEEEKLARDVYATAMVAYPDARVFSNINRAESTHMGEVQVLLERYDVADPTADRDPGEFADDSLQALYDDLVDKVAESRADAVQAGVDVEVTDIADLTKAMELDAPADVTAVLGNLLAGSERHLAAFQRNGGTVTDA